MKVETQNRNTMDSGAKQDTLTATASTATAIASGLEPQQHGDLVNDTPVVRKLEDGTEEEREETASTTTKNRTRAEHRRPLRVHGWTHCYDGGTGTWSRNQGDAKSHGTSGGPAHGRVQSQVKQEDEDEDDDPNTTTNSRSTLPSTATVRREEFRNTRSRTSKSHRRRGATEHNTNTTTKKKEDCMEEEWESGHWCSLGDHTSNNTNHQETGNEEEEEGKGKEKEESAIDETRDILCGQGNGARQWKPNSRYQQLILTNLTTYAAVIERNEKTNNVIEGILREVRGAGMRFLKQDTAVQQSKVNSMGRNEEAAAASPPRWIELNDDEARTTITQAIHDLLRIQQRTKANTVAAAAVGENKTATTSSGFIQLTTGDGTYDTSAKHLRKPITHLQAVDNTSQALREQGHTDTATATTVMIATKTASNHNGLFGQQQQQQQQQQLATSSSSTTRANANNIVMKANPYDILMGQRIMGQWHKLHPGNIRFRDTLAREHEEYEAADRSTRTRIVDCILKGLLSSESLPLITASSGGAYREQPAPRFLYKEEKNDASVTKKNQKSKINGKQENVILGPWLIASLEDAHDKITHDFRNMRQQEKVKLLVSNDALRYNDVLCGRGGAVLRHPGNQYYRRLVNLKKPLYLTCLTTEKIQISQSIVACIKEMNGRFLERDAIKAGVWNDIGDKKATEKTSQALREGQSKLRKQMDVLLQQHNQLALREGQIGKQMELLQQHNQLNVIRRNQILQQQQLQLVPQPQQQQQVGGIATTAFAGSSGSDASNHNGLFEQQQQLGNSNSSTTGCFTHPLFQRGRPELFSETTLQDCQQAARNSKHAHLGDHKDGTPAVTRHAKKDEKSGMILPEASLEVDFDVRNPPLEPSTPASKHPICESPADVNSFDVLCGRGNGTNFQVGNRRFRKLVQEFQPIYRLARGKEKRLLARTIVLIIRKRGGRFLKKGDETGELYEVGDSRAEAKTSQALREGLNVEFDDDTTAAVAGAAAAMTRMRVEHCHRHHQQQQQQHQHQQQQQQQVYRRRYHHEQLQQQQQKLHELRQRQQQHYFQQQQQQQQILHASRQERQQQLHVIHRHQLVHSVDQRQQQQQHHRHVVVPGNNTIHDGDTLLSCNDEEEEDNIADNFGDNAVSSDVDSYSYSGNNANLGHHKDGTSPAWPPTPHQLQQSKTAATVARTKTTTTVAAAARTTKRKAEPSLDEHPSKTKLSRSTIRNTSTSSIAIAAGVVSPRHHDIICGQGSSWIKNPGTVWYRTLIERYTKEHPVLAEQGKTHLAEIIFQAIRSPLKEDEDGSSSSSSCGRRRRRRRFLRRSKATDRWYEISEDKAKEKIRQALISEDKAKEKIRQALCVAELKTTRQHHAVRCSSHPLLQRGGPELVSQKSMNDCEHTATNSSTNRSHLTDDIAFPFKLHSILEYAEKTNRVDIISWLPSGDAFKIHKPQDFADTIMQQYFNQTKYRSFQRQLNIYNFDRVTDKASNEYGAYAHELFIRGHSDLCVNMTRQKIKGTGLSNEKRHYLASAKRALSYPKQTHEMQVAKAIIAKEIRAKKDEKSGMILPEASLEVDFDVRNPPLEPSTPASKHPICESPADVNSFDVTTEEVEDDEETENTKRTIDDNNAFDTTIIVKTKKSRISISTESVGAYLDEDPLIFVHDDEVDDDDDDDDNDDDENLFIII